MKAYKVVEPDTIWKLDAELRANPFGSGFPMTIEENLDGNDIAKRRGFAPNRKKVIFSPTSIDVGQDSENARMIMAMGITAINGVAFTGRISASDGDYNFPELLIV